MRCWNKHVVSSNKVLLFDEQENKKLLPESSGVITVKAFSSCVVFFKPGLCHFASLKSPAHTAFKGSSAAFLTSGHRPRTCCGITTG